MVGPMIVDMVPLSTPSVWAVVAACVALLAVFLLAVCAICRKDNADPLISEFIDLLIRRENNTICELIDSY